MPGESINERLERDRPPRVHIKYEVHKGDAVEIKELPFVVGVLADLSGHPAQAPPPLRDRAFEKITRDNFKDVMKKVGPRLRLSDGTTPAVELRFESLQDFEPDALVERVAKQDEAVKELVELRKRLRYTLNKIDGDDDLKRLLQNVLEASETQRRGPGAASQPGEDPT